MKELGCEGKLAIGMKVMVTQNIETDLDLTNGARDKIVVIVLNEPVIDEKKSLIKLEKMLLYFLMKLECTPVRPLSGLPQNVIPIQPHCVRHIIKVMDKDGHTSQKPII